MEQLVIKEKQEGQRLDKYLGKYLKEAPKSFLYKMLRKKNITLNGKKAQGMEILRAGDEIRLFLARETIEKFRGEELRGARGNLDIVYEDEQVLFVNKPVGMLSQKAAKDDVSLVEYITGYLMEEETEQTFQGFRPGICNRLDRNTSGLVAAGKSIQGLQELSRRFRERSMKKYYLALVKGKVDKSCHCKGFLAKDEKTNRVTISSVRKPDSQPIETKYRPLEVSGRGDTLLEVQLLTGRSHQIRAHLASMGHPVIGDWKYGEKKCNGYYREKYGAETQLLHAWKLCFQKEEGCLQGLSGKTVTASPPEFFLKVLGEEGFSEESWEENKGERP